MSRFLLDTQLLLWMVGDTGRLSAEVAEIMADGRNHAFFSLVSIWETAIKYALGRRDFTLPPAELRQSLLTNGFRELPIAEGHVLAVAHMPHFHRDPFDRLLVAQAKVEGLILMTTDKHLVQYGSHVQRFR